MSGTKMKNTAAINRWSDLNDSLEHQSESELEMAHAIRRYKQTAATDYWHPEHKLLPFKHSSRRPLYGSFVYPTFERAGGFLPLVPPQSFPVSGIYVGSARSAGRSKGILTALKSSFSKREGEKKPAVGVRTHRDPERASSSAKGSSSTRHCEKSCRSLADYRPKSVVRSQCLSPEFPRTENSAGPTPTEPSSFRAGSSGRLFSGETTIVVSKTVEEGSINAPRCCARATEVAAMNTVAKLRSTTFREKGDNNSHARTSQRRNTLSKPILKMVSRADLSTSIAPSNLTKRTACDDRSSETRTKLLSHSAFNVNKNILVFSESPLETGRSKMADPIFKTTPREGAAWFPYSAICSREKIDGSLLSMRKDMATVTIHSEVCKDKAGNVSLQSGTTSDPSQISGYERKIKRSVHFSISDEVFEYVPAEHRRDKRKSKEYRL